MWSASSRWNLGIHSGTKDLTLHLRPVSDHWCCIHVLRLNSTIRIKVGGLVLVFWWLLVPVWRSCRWTFRSFLFLRCYLKFGLNVNKFSQFHCVVVGRSAAVKCGFTNRHLIKTSSNTHSYDVIFYNNWFLFFTNFITFSNNHIFFLPEQINLFVLFLNPMNFR